MRLFLATLGATFALLAGTAARGRGAANATRPARPAAGAQPGAGQDRTPDRRATCVDLDTGQTLFSQAPNTGRLPASVEKLYTTSTALLRLGPNATFTTSVLGVGSRDPDGVWDGTLYLRGGGDPTFGSVGFDQSWYGTGTARRCAR